MPPWTCQTSKNLLANAPPKVHEGDRYCRLLLNSHRLLVLRAIQCAFSLWSRGNKHENTPLPNCSKLLQPLLNVPLPNKPAPPKANCWLGFQRSQQFSACSTKESLPQPKSKVRLHYPPCTDGAARSHAEVAKRGLLAPETWHCNRPYINLKTTIDVPLLGTVIEQNGDGCLEDSLMPVGWPLHLDGAVKQRCLHRTTTLRELDELLQAYDMKRNLVELNYEAAQWKHKAVWNRKYMEAKRGQELIQMWNEHEIDIARKTSNSYEVTANDVLRAASAAAKQPPACLPDSQFLRALGTEDVYTTPHLTSTLSLRAAEEWERCICENQAFSILDQAQEGRQELIKKDGGEMLVSIVLDRPLAEAKALVEDPETHFGNFATTLKPESMASAPIAQPNGKSGCKR